MCERGKVAEAKVVIAGKPLPPCTPKHACLKPKLATNLAVTTQGLAVAMQH